MHFPRYFFLALILFPFVIAARGQTVACNSTASDSEKHYCAADTRFGAKLIQQTSKMNCVEGKTWGWDEEGIWVVQGCGGQFAVGKQETAKPEAAPDHPAAPTLTPKKKEELMTCASTDGQRNYCDADLKGASVRLARQVGGAQCQENLTWGHDDKGIWVDRGCRGDFVVIRQGPAGDVSCEKSIGKKEAKKLVEECRQVSPATHPPCNTSNSCVLIKEEIRRSCEWLGKSAPQFCEEYK